MRIGKETGLNPTIPLCPYCGEGKNQIILTGYEGEKWAKKNGRSDGRMPMYVRLEGDIEPCDECKKKGIALVEVNPETKEPSGTLHLVKEEFIKHLLSHDSEMLNRVLKQRILMIPEGSLKLEN